MKVKIFGSLIVLLIFSQNLMAGVVLKNADFAKRRMPDSILLKTKKTHNVDPPVDMSLIGQMTYGQNFAINSKGSIVFYSEDQWIVIADYSIPAHPVILSRVRTPYVISRIRRNGNYLYVVSKYEDKFSIIDISDTTNPILKGNYDLGTWDIAINGRYAYTAKYLSGMNVLDISDPENVKILKTINSKEEVRFVYVDGNYLYRNHGFNFEIFSIADPLNPVKLSSISTEYSPVRDIIVENNILYCATNDLGIWVIDATDKYNPTVVSRYQGQWDFLTRIAKKGSRIYAATYSTGLSIMDYSDIKNPKEVALINQFDQVSSTHINNDLLYVGDVIEGVYAFDISNPDTLRQLHHHRTFGFIHDVAVKDSIAFLLDLYFGVRIVNISNPKVPYEIGWFRTPGRQREVFIKDDYLFIPSDTSGLRIFNIEDINNIRQVSIIRGFQSISCVIDSTLLYVSSRGSGLRIFDISDIYNPVQIGHFYSEAIVGIDRTILKPPYAYLLNMFSGVMVINIQNPANPELVNNRLLSYPILSMDIHDNFLFTGFDSWGVKVFDISNPDSILELGYYKNWDDKTWSLHTTGQYTYLATNKILALNTKDKAHPELCASYDTDSMPQKFEVENDTIYLADLYDGLYIIKHDRTTAIDPGRDVLPHHFHLSQNYPNPFNSQTRFNYEIAEKAHVTLDIYNLLGQKILTLVDEQKTSGQYSIQWDASDRASGLYLYRLTLTNKNGTFTHIKKCILLK